MSIVEPDYLTFIGNVCELDHKSLRKVEDATMTWFEDNDDHILRQKSLKPTLVCYERLNLALMYRYYKDLPPSLKTLLYDRVGAGRSAKDEWREQIFERCQNRSGADEENE